MSLLPVVYSRKQFWVFALCGLFQTCPPECGLSSWWVLGYRDHVLTLWLIGVMVIYRFAKMRNCPFEAEPHNWTCPHSDTGGLSTRQKLKRQDPQNRWPSVQKPPSPHVLASLALNSRLWWSVDSRKPVVFSLRRAASAPTQLPLCLWNSPHPVVLPSHSAAGCFFFLSLLLLPCLCSVNSCRLCLLSMVMSEMSIKPIMLMFSITFNHVKASTLTWVCTVAVKCLGDFVATASLVF